ncbi:hypothetical protein HG263_06825 [Pseudoalteromonas sp. JBTF-M23]|uniref:Uncharacterized protein n=1 Tax=Pseudoalteromonas caenipelagi TaxID=2726988 RepID=A0A849VAF3_9GAMM|nr:hypothetical protein [Pseudoalteromonas caenipelagi]NOU50256.1 hypothetical protein [Pseudoalteromonas caenipelagi]
MYNLKVYVEKSPEETEPQSIELPVVPRVDEYILLQEQYYQVTKVIYTLNPDTVAELNVTGQVNDPTTSRIKQKEVAAPRIQMF